MHQSIDNQEAKYSAKFVSP